jgi:hypothetical protein
MKTLLSLLSRGFARARRHPWLLLIVYLVPLVPALMAVIAMARMLGEPLAFSLFSDRILDGRWFGVWVDLLASQGDQIPTYLATVIPAIFLFSILLQIVLAAIVIEVMLESEPAGPLSLATIGRSSWRFLRSAVWFVISMIPVVILASLVNHGFDRLAVSQADARYDLLAMLSFVIIVLLGLIPLDLAYDLSRIASARHDDRSTFFGFIRALLVVLRRPGLFAPLYLVLAALPLALYLAYAGIWVPWVPGSAFAIVMLFILQQLVMLVRAGLKIWFWGVEIECYQLLEEPRW